MNENLKEKVSVGVTLGHLLALWQLMSDKISGEPINNNFTETEKRVIWAFQDICENELEKNSITVKPENEWNQLIEKAHAHVRTLNVEYLDK